MSYHNYDICATDELKIKIPSVFISLFPSLKVLKFSTRIMCGGGGGAGGGVDCVYRITHLTTTSHRGSSGNLKLGKYYE